MTSESSSNKGSNERTTKIILAMIFVMLAVFSERLADFEQVLKSHALVAVAPDPRTNSDAVV